ncbi:MAG: hypothetical protein HQ519_17735 [Planctomycetes bacterium]|nr:hypothetical protein [Planctomycetota bacterium]
MTAPRTWHSLLGTIVACLLLGMATYWLTIWVLQASSSDEGQQPVELDASILQETDPYLADLRAAAQIVRERWSYGEHRAQISGLDLAALEKTAVALLGDQPDNRTFKLALTYFIAGLKDGHAFVSTPEHTLAAKHRWPFSLVEVAEGIMVHGVHADLPSPKPGDLLRTVDGVAIEEFISNAEHQVFASTDLSRRHQAIQFMCKWDTNPEREFGFESADAKQFAVSSSLPPYYQTMTTPALISKERKHRMLENGVAYFCPGNFSPPADSGWPGPPEKRDAILADTYAEFDRIIGELAQCRALILDLRHNPGGTDLLGQFLVDRLVDPGYVYYQLSSDFGMGWLNFGKHKSTAAKGENSIRAPLICLIDERTFSTADNVAACLADVHPNVRFVGRPNGAGTGAPRPFELPRTGATIHFCTMRVRTPNGRMGEGLSIPLTESVTWTRDDVLQLRDPDLQKALDLLDPN